MTKNKSGKYRKTLLDFLRLIKTQYKPGERLPTAREMCNLLDVSTVTYQKILEEANFHRHIIKRLGRGGIVVPPTKGNNIKIGLQIENNQNPVILENDLLCSFLSGLLPYHYSRQIIDECKLEYFYENLIVLNVSLLVTFSKSFEMDSFLQNNRNTSGVPILVLRNGCLLPMRPNENTFYLNSNPHYAGKMIAQTILESGFQRPMKIQPKDNPLGEYIRFHLPKEIPLELYPHTDGGSRAFKVLRKIREKQPDVLFFSGGCPFSEQVFSGLEKLPKKNRPAVYADMDKGVGPEYYHKFPGIDFRGVLSYDSSFFSEVAISMITDYFEKGKPLQNFGVNNLRIEKI